jgi:tRNA(His) 5'-end guanylyltransferase
MGDGLGDRMKDYERRETGRKFLPMLPVYARVDGRGFSKFTSGMERPFDSHFSDAMIATARHLVDHCQARIGYTQSDEISLVWLAADPKSEMFFDGKIQKMTSIVAALATAAFTRALLDGPLAEYASRLPHFDARLFQLPSRTEAANVLLWRELDATKNAIGMAARHLYPHEALHGRSNAALQEMLFARGINFNDYPARFKRGTFLRRITEPRDFASGDSAATDPSRRATHARVIPIPMPRFASVTNREAVLFDGAEPEQAQPA